MVSKSKRFSRLVMTGLCSVVLAVVLVACGGTTAAPTPTPTPPPSPTPSPTPSPGLTTYTGNGYTIGYPQGWTVKQGASNTVIFTDPTHVYRLSIAVAPNPNGTLSADSEAGLALDAAKAGLKNPQTEKLPPTTTVGGDSWSQKAVSGTGMVNGQSSVVELVILADNHPATSAATRAFIIGYGTAKNLLNTVSTMYFQPMLQSFKFTS